MITSETITSNPVTILFADIVGSTGLYENFGNEQAHTLIHGALSQVQAIVLNARGLVVKSIGDELMCSFETAPDALLAACDIQTRFLSSSGPLPRLSFRIGLHSGAAIRKGNDLFGDAVNVAARLSGIAIAGQILTSWETLEESPKFPCRDIGYIRVKGRVQEVHCVEVIWSDEKELTTSHVMNETTAPALMALVYGGKSYFVNESNSRLRIGRGEDNDIVVDSSLVSKIHAVVECRRQLFFLRDHSTNGSLIFAAGRVPHVVRREEVNLFGEGTILLGGRPQEAERSIQFQSSLGLIQLG